MFGCYIVRDYILVFLWMLKADASFFFFTYKLVALVHMVVEHLNVETLWPLLTHSTHVVLIMAVICLKVPIDLNEVGAFSYSTFIHILSFACICV